jgi:hypothetical protein
MQQQKSNTSWDSFVNYKPQRLLKVFIFLLDLQLTFLDSLGLENVGVGSFPAKKAELVKKKVF